MSAATAQTGGRSGTSRRFPRSPLATPVDVVVLRAGVPENIPGRSVNVSEGGLAAILAGELRLNQLVGLELRLPHLSLPIQTRARVRHQVELQCGLEFLGLSPEQRELIRYWTRRDAPQPAAVVPTPAKAGPTAHISPYGATAVPGAKTKAKRSFRFLRRSLAIAAGVLLVVGLFVWWNWQRDWTQLEGQVPRPQTVMPQNRARISPEVAQTLLIHRVDPDYPAMARAANVQGVVVLDMVIGRDGAVLDLHPVSGPEALTAAAIDAVKWWRFQPYQENGQAMEVETTVAVEFRL